MSNEERRKEEVCGRRVFDMREKNTWRAIAYVGDMVIWGVKKKKRKGEKEKKRKEKIVIWPCASSMCICVCRGMNTGQASQCVGEEREKIENEDNQEAGSPSLPRTTFFSVGDCCCCCSWWGSK